MCFCPLGHRTYVRREEMRRVATLVGWRARLAHSLGDSSSCALRGWYDRLSSELAARALRNGRGNEKTFVAVGKIGEDESVAASGETSDASLLESPRERSANEDIGTGRVYSFSSSEDIRQFKRGKVSIAKVTSNTSEETLVFETGKLACLAHGSVVVTLGGTQVLATVCTSIEDDGPPGGGLNLSVEHSSRAAAAALIPRTRSRRDPPAGERDILMARLVDRSLRPLFPTGMTLKSNMGIQVITRMLSDDSDVDPTPITVLAASAALLLTPKVQWNGPVGYAISSKSRVDCFVARCVRLCRIGDTWRAHPRAKDLVGTDAEIVYSGTATKCVMIEASAGSGKGISNEDMVKALKIAQIECAKVLEAQIELSPSENTAQNLSAMQRDILQHGYRPWLQEWAWESVAEEFKKIYQNSKFTKASRGGAIARTNTKGRTELQKRCEEEDLTSVPSSSEIAAAVHSVEKTIIRQKILEDNWRPDGRNSTQLRPLYMETGPLGSKSCITTHGSSLFERGETQTLSTVTVGGVAYRTVSDFPSLTIQQKPFMLHYTFLPFAVNEIRKIGGPNRREIGHGALAEKALAPVVPTEESFPFSVRVTADTLASNGSSSMAAICGGSLALMEAGVPTSEHVAGVSIGLVADEEFYDSEGESGNSRLLVDIQGVEDHFGDMDLKIAGTSSGITAIQLDVKPAGIPLQVIIDALEPALNARRYIIGLMNNTISAARGQNDGVEVENPSDPQWGSIEIEAEYVKKVIGLGGETLREIEKTTGARLTVMEDGVVHIYGPTRENYDAGVELVISTAKADVHLDKVYKCVIEAVRDFGCLVQILPSKQRGLLHISELSHDPPQRIDKALASAANLKEGASIFLMCIGKDLRGNYQMSRKALIPVRYQKRTDSDSEDQSKETEEG